MPVQTTSSELELNAYFRERLIPTLPDEFNRDLWNIHIPQGTLAETSIWHACNAIAAACRWRTVRSSTSNSDQLLSRTLNEEGLKQTAASFKGIAKITSQSSLSPAEKSTVLAASLLLSYWYSRIDDSKSSDAIISYMIRLFQQWRLWHDEQRGPIPSRHILLYIIKTERRLADSALLAIKRPWHWKDALESIQSQPMSSSRDACIEMEMILAGLQCLLENLPLRQAEMRETHAKRTIFHHYAQKFDERFRAFGKFSCVAQERTRIAIIEVRRMLVHAMLVVDLTLMETCWDVGADTFAAATSRIEFILATNESFTSLPEFTPMLAKSLSWMGKVCRQPALRRKMASLLNGRVEKMYTLFATKRSYHFPFTNILNSVIAAEESRWAYQQDRHEQDDECSYPGCTTNLFICNNHRVTEISLDPDPINPRDDLLTVRTVADVLGSRPGRTQYVVALTWS